MKPMIYEYLTGEPVPLTEFQTSNLFQTTQVVDYGCKICHCPVLRIIGPEISSRVAAHVQKPSSTGLGTLLVSY